MPSKTVKNKCAHIFIQGSKKGKRCNANCVKKFCKFHTKKTKEKKLEYYNNKKQEKEVDEHQQFIDKINNIDELDDLPDLNKLLSEKKMIWNEYLHLLKKKAGIRIFLGEDENEISEEIKDFQYGECKCEQLRNQDEENNNEKFIEYIKMFKDELIRKLCSEFIKNNKDIVRQLMKEETKNGHYIDNYNLIAYDKVKIYLKKDIESQWNEKLEKNRDKYMEEYNKYIRHSNESIQCNRCSSLKTFFKYKGKSKDMAKKKLKRLKFKMDNLNTQYIAKVKIIKVIKDKEQKLKYIEV